MMKEVKIAKNTIYKMEYRLDQELTLAENNEQINVLTNILEKQGFHVVIYSKESTQDTVTITYCKPLNEDEYDICELVEDFINNYKHAKDKNAQTLGSFKKDKEGRGGLELWRFVAEGVDVDVDILVGEESILGVHCKVEKTTYAGADIYHPIFDSLHK